MSLHDHVSRDSKPEGSFFASRSGLVLIGFLAIAGFFLFTEHRAHLLGYFCSDQCQQKFLSTLAGASPEDNSGCAVSNTRTAKVESRSIISREF